MAARARILVVDDEHALMRMLCETLEEAGYETSGCTSGTEALTKLAHSGVDLLLTDLRMPDMDGTTLLREACKQDPMLVGVMMTGEGTIRTVIEAMKAGALDYILKPFRPLEAMPVLNRALGVRRLRVENHALERQVREHAAELEVKNQELEAFAYSVSHDLRAPLRRIDQFSEKLVLEHAHHLEPSVQRLLERIRSNTGLMGNLIDDLLALSQVNQAPLVREDIDLSLEAQQVIDVLQQQSPERRVSVRIAPNLHWQADRGLTRIILENVIGNAWKYTSKVAAPLISIESQSSPNAWLIRDNGAGFDTSQAGRLFAPFQRFHRADEFSGTGIGLSIVARIISRHQGRIRAESTPGQGTTFFLSVGSQEQAAAHPSAETAESPLTPAAGNSHG